MEADSIAQACSRDCRFEWTRALRIEFSCRVEDEVRAARKLTLAIDSEHDGYWVDAYVALLEPVPQDAEWVQRYWSDRMDGEGRLPPELRASLVGEVRRIARIQSEEVHRLIEWYTAIARDRGLDPRRIVRDPFERVNRWLTEK